jgi:uncharacterized protein Yka (UPF0111/DUF47 family)
VQIFVNGIEQLFGIYGNDVLVLVTAILVGVTAFYALQTKRTVASMEKSNAYQFLPHVKSSLVELGPMDLELQISNVGKGPAKEVNVNFYLKEAPNIKKQWNQPLLVPNDFRKFLIPKNVNEVETHIDYFKNNQTTLIIKSDYRDVLGYSHMNEEVIDVTSYVAQYGKIFSPFIETPTEKISRSVEKIATDLSNLSQQVYNINKNIGNLSFRQLKDFQRSYALKIIENEDSLDTTMKQRLEELINSVIALELASAYKPALEQEIKDKLMELRATNDKLYEKIIEAIPNLRRYNMAVDF